VTFIIFCRNLESKNRTLKILFDINSADEDEPGIGRSTETVAEGLIAIEYDNNLCCNKGVQILIPSFT